MSAPSEKLPEKFDIDGLILQPLLEIFGDGDEGFTYAPASGASVFSVNGVFDEAYIDNTPTPDIAVTGEQPVVGVREAVFQLLGKPLPLQGDRLTRVLTGKPYIVREVRRDGHGHQLLMLNDQGFA